MKFLVVDDSEFDNKYAKMLFSRVGKYLDWHAEFASGAEEALDLLQEQDFDIILTDYQMPGMNGMELLKRVHFLDIDIPVVIMTSQGSEELALSSLRNGAANYVIKKRLAAELPGIVAKLKSTVNANGQTKLY